MTINEEKMQKNIFNFENNLKKLLYRHYKKKIFIYIRNTDNAMSSFVKL